MEQRIGNIRNGLINRRTKLDAVIVRMLFDEFEIVVDTKINLRLVDTRNTNMNVRRAIKNSPTEDFLCVLVNF